MALLNGFALAYAPLGYEPSNGVQPGWQAAPERPFVPPPAPPGRLWQAGSPKYDNRFPIYAVTGTPMDMPLANQGGFDGIFAKPFGVGTVCGGPHTVPPQGVFSEDAEMIARKVADKQVSPKGIGSAIRMVQYVVNRGGKGLTAHRERELEKAKLLLQQKAKCEKAKAVKGSA